MTKWNRFGVVIFALCQISGHGFHSHRTQRCKRVTGLKENLHHPQAAAAIRPVSEPIIAKGKSESTRGASQVDATNSVASAGQWRLAVLFLTVLWSTNFAAIKDIFLVIPDLEPSLYATVRFGIAALVLLPTYYNALGNIPLVKDSFIIGAWVMVGYVGQSLGLKLGSSADKSAFISSLVVVWVAIAPYLINAIRTALKSSDVRPVKTPIWSTVILAVTGIAILELEGSSPPVWGDALSLLQPVGFGTSYLLIEKMMKNEGYAANLEAPRQATGLRVLAIALLSLLWAIFAGSLRAENMLEITQSPEVSAGLLYLGCITTAGGLWLQSLAFRRVSASDASMILSSEPVWAALFASALLHEGISLSDCIGGGFIISACLANEFLASRDKEAVKE